MHKIYATEGIHLGFASDSNTSGYVIYFPSTGKTLISNQVRFDESNFQYRKQSVIDRHVEDELVNILKEEGAVNWEPYDKTLPHGSYKKVHYDPASDELVLKVKGKNNTYARVTQNRYLGDLLQLQQAHIARTQDSASAGNGALPGVDLNKPPKNFRDALRRIDAP